MKRNSLLYASLAATLILTAGCATNSRQPVVTLSERRIEQPTIAVLPFAVTKQRTQPTEGELNLRQFERTYFPYRLITALHGTGQSAYFSPSITPAADYNVVSTIVKSDGKMTVLQVKLIAGDETPLWSQRFTVNVASVEYKKNPDPAGRIWPQIAKAIAKTKQKPGDLTVRRTNGYGKTLPVNDARARMAVQASEVERTKLLAPATKELTTKAPLGNELYIKWQTEATPVIEERSRQKTAQTMGGIAMLMGGVAGGLNAYSGNMAGVQQSNATMLTAAATVEIADAKITEINKTLSHLSSEVATHKGAPLSVVLFGKTYQLTGSMEEQQTELRRIVAAELSQIQG